MVEAWRPLSVVQVRRASRLDATGATPIGPVYSAGGLGRMSVSPRGAPSFRNPGYGDPGRQSHLSQDADDLPVVGGSSGDPGGGDAVVLMDPSTGKPGFAVAEAGPDRVAEAMRRARVAAPAWAGLGLSERGRRLTGAAEQIAHDDELVDLIVSDVGKPIREARAERSRAHAILRYYAGLAQGPVGEVYEDAAGELVRVLRAPRGVAALITPWNFPLAIPTWKAAPALLAGNAVALKPAPAGSRVAARLVACLHGPGVPVDVCAMIAGDASSARRLLAARPDVISFTGSLAVGKRVAAAAGELRIPVQLEMGGQNAVYVAEAADADATAAIVAEGGMSFAGQKCTATSRVVVHVRQAEALAQSLSDHLKDLPTGNPHRDEVVVGPLINAAARDHALKELEEAVDRGVHIDAGGAAVEGDGYYLAPTLISGGESDDRIYREEVFAPVIGVKSVSSFEEGLSEVNATRYGLVAGIVSPPAQRLRRLPEAPRQASSGSTLRRPGWSRMCRLGVRGTQAWAHASRAEPDSSSSAKRGRSTADPQDARGQYQTHVALRISRP